MTARLYKSTDASAPVLTGQNGSLVALLLAVLVNGYGSQTAAGWTEPYTATNKAVFRNSASTGTGFYLDVDDSGPGAGAAREARVKGYEVMTAVATGTNPFPTVAQMTNGLFVRKSTTADATARPWYILADDTVFYLFIESGDYTAPTRATAFMFGDFYSYKTSDAYRCMIIGRDAENTGSQANENFPVLANKNGAVVTSQTTNGHYLARGTAGAGGSVPCGLHGDCALVPANNTTYPSMMGQSTGIFGSTYPNPADNGLYMAPAYVHHSAGVRGYLKGLWIPSHDLPLGHGDTFTGTGALSAKSFLCMQMYSFTYTSYNAECFLETSNTWS